MRRKSQGLPNSAEFPESRANIFARCTLFMWASVLIALVASAPVFSQESECMSSQQILAGENTSILPPCDEDADFLRTYCKPEALTAEEEFELSFASELFPYYPFAARLSNDRVNMKLAAAEDARRSAAMSDELPIDRPEVYELLYSALSYRILTDGRIDGEYREAILINLHEVFLYLQAYGLPELQAYRLPGENEMTPDSIIRATQCLVQCDAGGKKQISAIFSSVAFRRCVGGQ